MEANEAQELQEHAEHGASESALRPVAFTMSVLAVLVAVTTVLGHRTHTQAILYQNQATDMWNEFQAHNIRSYATMLSENSLKVFTLSDKAEAEKLANDYADREKKWADKQKDEQAEATALQAKVEQAEARADRFDLAEALLEIGLVITSVTLLTRRYIYWLGGLFFSAFGVISGVSAFLLK